MMLPTWPTMWLITISAGTQMTIPMGFGAQQAQTQTQPPSGTAMYQNATLSSPQGMFRVRNGMGGEPIGNGTMRYQTHAKVGLIKILC